MTRSNKKVAAMLNGNTNKRRLFLLLYPFSSVCDKFTSYVHKKWRLNYISGLAIYVIGITLQHIAMSLSESKERVVDNIHVNKSTLHQKIQQK